MNNNSSSGLGFCSVLQIVFIVLKLLDVIKWKWIWVLSPFWVSIAVVLVGAIVLSIISKKKRM